MPGVLGGGLDLSGCDQISGRASVKFAIFAPVTGLSVPGTKNCAGFMAHTASSRAAFAWDTFESNGASPLAILPIGPRFRAMTRTNRLARADGILGARAGLEAYGVYWTAP